MVIPKDHPFILDDGKTIAPIIPPHETFAVQTTTVYIDSRGGMHHEAMHAAQITTQERIADWLKTTGMQSYDAETLSVQIALDYEPLFDILRAYDTEVYMKRDAHS